MDTFGNDINKNEEGHHANRELAPGGNSCLRRLAIPKNVETLDFRSTEYWSTRSINSLVKTIDTTVSRWNPPDEFDWFSCDRIGKIITMIEAAEIFSELKTSKCTMTLKEFMINVTRPHYWSCSPHQMSMISNTLFQMNLITKLILSGMADDHMLKLIGERIPGLKHLDVSFSKFVTDQGVQNLFFADTTKDYSALCLIPSWIVKHLHKMCPLVNTLTYLDFSWTNISSLSRKMVNLMPGSYLFKRFFAPYENEAHGHHIFVRKTPEMSMAIRLKDLENEFEAKLQLFAGKTGSDHFLKFVESHPWRNCNLAIYLKPVKPTNENLGENDPVEQYVGFITPSKEEKRIHGLIVCTSGNLTELYSIYPINLNQLGLACLKLEALRGIVTDEWKQSSFLVALTHVELFCEPITACSILAFCPNLKMVKIRILKKILADQPFIEAIRSSMCKRTLEELWIAPGSFKKCAGFNCEKNSEQPSTSAELRQVCREPTVPDFAHLPSSSSREEFPMNFGTRNFHSITSDGLSEKDERIEDLIHLSINCARTIINDCENLRRLGNLNWWSIKADQMEVLSKEIKDRNPELVLWENLVIPSVCTLPDGKIIPN